MVNAGPTTDPSWRGHITTCPASHPPRFTWRNVALRRGGVLLDTRQADEPSSSELSTCETERMLTTAIRLAGLARAAKVLDQTAQRRRFAACEGGFMNVSVSRQSSSSWFPRTGVPARVDPCGCDRRSREVHLVAVLT